MVDQLRNPETHTCECGYEWVHGLSGSHACGPHYRSRIAKLESQLQATTSQARDSALEEVSALVSAVFDDQSVGISEELPVILSRIETMRTSPAPEQRQELATLRDELRLIRNKTEFPLRSELNAICDRLDVLSSPAQEAPQASELPTLPEPDLEACDSELIGKVPVPALPDYYTADQMRDYARTAIASAGAGMPDDAESEWRRLALQFDGHRMHALGHLKALLRDPQGHRAAVETFLSAGPLSGEEVLAQRITALSGAADKLDAQEWKAKFEWLLHNGGMLNEWAKQWIPEQHGKLIPYLERRIANEMLAALRDQGKS